MFNQLCDHKCKQQANEPSSVNRRGGIAGGGFRSARGDASSEAELLRSFLSSIRRIVIPAISVPLRILSCVPDPTIPSFLVVRGDTIAMSGLTVTFVCGTLFSLTVRFRSLSFIPRFFSFFFESSSKDTCASGISSLMFRSKEGSCIPRGDGGRSEPPLPWRSGAGEAGRAR